MTGIVVEVHPAARVEIDEAEEWYWQREPRASAGFLREIERALELIAETPDVWPSYEAGTRIYRLRTFPYDVIYRFSGATVVVVAVAHQRRKPRYWRAR